MPPSTAEGRSGTAGGRRPVVTIVAFPPVLTCALSTAWNGMRFPNKRCGGRSVTFQKCVPLAQAVRSKKRADSECSDVPSAHTEFWADTGAAHRAGLNEYWGACKSARYAQNLMPPSPLRSFAHPGGYEAATLSSAHPTDRPTRGQVPRRASLTGDRVRPSIPISGRRGQTPGGVGRINPTERTLFPKVGTEI